MLAQIDVHSVNEALLLANLISNLRSAQAQPLCDQVMRAAGYNDLNSFFVPATDSCPAYYYVRLLTRDYLAIDGTTTKAQAGGIAANYFQGFDFFPTRPTNKFFEDAWFSIVANLKNRGVPSPYQLLVGGWSLGGAIAINNWGTNIATRSWGELRAIHTFGSPKAYDVDRARRLAQSAYIFRWMNDNDPVPVVPPTLGEAPFLIGYYGYQGSVAASYFVQPEGGVLLDPFGVATPAVVPPRATANFAASLSDWIQAWDQGHEADHFITQYIRRLGDLLKSLTPLDRNAGHGGPPEVPNPNNRRDMNAAQQAAVQTVVNLERQQNARPVVIPLQRRFVAVQLSGIWYVIFNGSIVSLGGSKKGARHLANVGNEFLRGLQNRPAVDAPTLLQQFADYLNEAQIPDNGYTPPLNVGF